LAPVFYNDIRILKRLLAETKFPILAVIRTATETHDANLLTSELTKLLECLLSDMQAL